MDKKVLLTIVGPTGIGKTALSIAFAKAYNTHIISCDSRQFYKEMTIGTAVPSPEELAAAPHHFIQNKSIHERFTAGDFEKEALQKAIKLFEKHNVLILVGGSALYEKALTHGLDDFPEVPQSIIDNLQRAFEQNGLEWLQHKLKKLDPTYYDEVDIQNPRRLLRAITLIESSGKTVSSMRSKNVKSRPFTILKIGLTAPREVVYSRIERRVDVMMREGLIDEAKRLLPHKELPALKTVGYAELFAHLNKEHDLDKAVALIKQNTRRFAKRQLTWYRGNTDVTWYDYDMPHKLIVQQISERILSAINE